MQVSLKWLKDYIDTGMSPKDLAHKITMGGIEVEEIRVIDGDSILVLAPTPNRGDALSMIGVAREIAALTGKKAKLPKFEPPKGSGKMKETIQVVVGDSKACPRYTARVVSGVKVGPSPDWLKHKVEAGGVRSINNVVDATNFVLMEMGQPVHAFDARFLKGKKLIIDKAKKNIKLKALDENEYEFTPEDILNLDAERAIGAAGIMGGENSGVLDDTTVLVLESAYFDPITVRRTSKRTGLFSESSKRFEKGVDPEGVVNALHRLTGVILDVAGGSASEDWVDLYPRPFKQLEVELTVHETNWLLGTELDAKTIASLLERVGCEIVKSTAEKLSVKIPTSRPDIERSVDLIEEVARIYGFEKIHDSMPVIKIRSIEKPKGRGAEMVARATLTSLGFFEAVTYSFASKAETEMFGEAVKLANPLTSEMENMRRSLLPSLITSLKNNLVRQIEDVKLFELNKVYIPAKGHPTETLMLSGVACGHVMPAKWDGASSEIDIFDVKAALWTVFERLGVFGLAVIPATREYLNPAESFDIIADGKPIGCVGRIHPSIEKRYDLTLATYVFEINFDHIIDAHTHRRVAYKPLSRFPVMTRDIALLVDSRRTHKELLQTFNKYVNDLVQNVELFDIYQGKGIPEGKKSMAYRVIFGSFERTLEEAEVDSAFKKISDGVKSELGAEIR